MSQTQTTKGGTMAEITITVPAGKPGHVNAYRIRFEKSRFAEILDTIPTFTCDQDVIDAVNSGLFESV